VENLLRTALVNDQNKSKKQRVSIADEDIIIITEPCMCDSSGQAVTDEEKAADIVSIIGAFSTALQDAVKLSCPPPPISHT